MPFLKRDGVSIHDDVAGTGAPLLLIQGVGVVGDGWLPQVRALQGEYQTLRFDNRGVGRSVPCTGPVSIDAMAQDALALMDALGWQSAHVVGHSMGGLIAQHVALLAPKRVRSLSLLCTFAQGSEGARVTPWVLWVSLRTRIGTRAMRRRAFLELVISSKLKREGNLDRIAAEWAPLMGRDLAEQPSILLKQVRAMAKHNAYARLPELRSIPTLVVSATEDPIAQPKYGRRLAAAIPGARYEELGGASHAVVIEAPERINPLLRDFLAASERNDG